LFSQQGVSRDCRLKSYLKIKEKQLHNDKLEEIQKREGKEAEDLT